MFNFYACSNQVLSARKETAQLIIIDARHLTLLRLFYKNSRTENFYKTNVRENICFLRLFGADEHLSVSSNL